MNFKKEKKNDSSSPVQNYSHTGSPIALQCSWGIEPWVSSAASFSVCPVSSCKKDSVSCISLVLKPPCTQWVLRPELTHGLILLVKQKHVFQLSYLPQPICFQWLHLEKGTFLKGSDRDQQIVTSLSGMLCRALDSTMNGKLYITTCWILKDQSGCSGSTSLNNEDGSMVLTLCFHEASPWRQELVVVLETIKLAGGGFQATTWHRRAQTTECACKRQEILGVPQGHKTIFLKTNS